MQPHDTIKSVLDKFENPSPVLLMPFLLHSPDQETRTAAAVKMAELIATESHPHLGIVHLLRMVKCSGTQKSTRATCLLAMLESDKVEWIDLAIEAWYYFDDSERIELLNLIQVKRYVVMINFIYLVWVMHYDQGNKEQGEIISSLAYDLFHSTEHNDLLVDYDHLIEPTEEELAEETNEYDPLEIGVMMPNNTEPVISIPQGNRIRVLAYMNWDQKEPTSAVNPLILVGKEAHLKYDGHTFRLTNIEAFSNVLDDEEVRLNQSIYISPENFMEGYMQGSLSLNFLKENPGHLAWYLSQVFDTEYLDVGVDLLQRADSNLKPILDAIRSDLNKTDRRILLFSEENNGSLDMWYNELELLVDDQGEMTLRILEDFSLQDVLYEEDADTNFGGKITSHKWVVMGEEQKIQDVGSLMNLCEELIEHAYSLTYDFNYAKDKIDISQAIEFNRLSRVLLSEQVGGA